MRAASARRSRRRCGGILTRSSPSEPDFAPALHLLGVVALAQGERDRARDAFAAAVAAAPEFVEARIEGAELALERRDAEHAVRSLREGLERSPRDLALLRMLGHAHLALRDGAAAEEAFRQVLVHAPADGDAHFNHGIALQMQGDAQGAARAYQRALTFKPDLVAADFNLGVLFQQQANTQAAIAAYSNVLAADPRHVAAYKNLGEVLAGRQSDRRMACQLPRLREHCPKALPLAVYALEACQHLADFASLERYIDGLRQERIQARDEEELADCLEELLYLLLFFDVEPGLLLRFAHAYDAVAARVYGTPMARPAGAQTRLLRIGYLSADLRNHVMGKMMWQAIAHHDRAQLEMLLLCELGRARRVDAAVRERGEALRGDRRPRRCAQPRRSSPTTISTSSSTCRRTRAARGRASSRASRARVQITHVASAGTVGLSAIDYKLTDHLRRRPGEPGVPDRATAGDGRLRVSVPARRAGGRASVRSTDALGLPADAIVIGAFVSPLKLSRRCLGLWRDVLARIPRAVLAFSPANPALRDSYLRLAQATRHRARAPRILPQGRDDAENQARYRLVDFVLDTMPFGGVNGTIEALDMGVPVVTLVGKRHGERTSFSILRNLGVTATIAEHRPRAMSKLPDAWPTIPRFRADVRTAIAAGLAQSPLVDMVAHTAQSGGRIPRGARSAAPDVWLAA